MTERKVSLRYRYSDFSNVVYSILESLHFYKQIKFTGFIKNMKLLSKDVWNSCHHQKRDVNVEIQCIQLIQMLHIAFFFYLLPLLVIHRLNHTESVTSFSTYSRRVVQWFRMQLITFYFIVLIIHSPSGVAIYT